MFPRIFTLFSLLFLIAFYGVVTSCGGGGRNVHNNFTSAPPAPGPVTLSIDPNNTQQTVTIPAGAGDQNAAIGEVAPVTADRVLCVMIDPRSGEEADLEVCEKSQANPSADSPNGVCPEADQITRCASVNLGSGPDFCQVTGDTEYIFVILNLTSQSSFVAYQVIDVTDLPTQSCAELNSSDASLTADDA